MAQPANADPPMHAHRTQLLACLTGDTWPTADLKRCRSQFHLDSYTVFIGVKKAHTCGFHGVQACAARASRGTAAVLAVSHARRQQRGRGRGRWLVAVATCATISAGASRCRTCTSASIEVSHSNKKKTFAVTCARRWLMQS